MFRLLVASVRTISQSLSTKIDLIQIVNGVGSKTEIRDMAARICRDYLHGAWKNVTGKEIGLSRVTGGLSNWLYHVYLPASLPPLGSEPSQVLLRLYGQMHGERALEGLITESVIFTLLSERRLGPGLHGVFPGGRIEEFINARSLNTCELSDPKMSRLIAEKMASIHLMNVPISKEPDWLWETLQMWLESALENLNSPGQVKPEFQAAVARLQTYDLQAEFDGVRELVSSGHYPVVFCHNDLQEGNILLLLGDGRSEAEAVADPRLVLIDFEYCSYNYRGFDLANHFIEWMYDYKCDNHPFFSISHQNYPTLEQRLVYIREYLRVTRLERPNHPPVDENTLLREVEVFSLVSHLLWGLWSIVQAKMNHIPFGYWDYAVERLDSYSQLKKRLPFGDVPGIPGRQPDRLPQV